MVAGLTNRIGSGHGTEIDSDKVIVDVAVRSSDAVAVNGRDGVADMVASDRDVVRVSDADDEIDDEVVAD
ncbi:MAG: hypothetical protein Q8J97_05505 [Flavobacteriaceae bacterium]|nr:hypothetical protein [Flavobacteriaceae bacterium]